MQHTWRWFGPDDPINLSDIRQAGATGIVTALHQLPNGVVWSKADIAERKKLIEDAGLEWVVTESIPIHEDIKTQSDGWEVYADAWAETAVHLAEAGIKTICYNFMPVLDWTRTSLRHPLPDGALCLRYDALSVAAFDLYILERPNAEKDYQPEVRQAAQGHLDQMSANEVNELTRTILAGLPGAEESYTLDSFRQRLTAYDGITPDKLRSNLADFLKRVMPRVESSGARIAIHPDDPPYSLFGLPRVVSTASDMQFILKAYDSNANGITFCPASLSARADNDVVSMLKEQADRIHFLHLRNITVESDGASFFEDAHLDGDTDMVELIDIILDIEAERKEQLPFRPDHGHAMLSDLRSGFRPGYPAIGRLRGMAEIRGVERALMAKRRPVG